MARVDDRVQLHAGRQRVDQPRVELVVVDLPGALKVQGEQRLVEAVGLVAVRVARLAAVARVVEDLRQFSFR